jgi:signal transduction histidine kinase
MGPLWAIERPFIAKISLAHLLLWIAGISGIVISNKSLAKQVLAREMAEEELRKSRDELSIRVQERTAEILQVNETLHNLSSKLMSVQENERKRVALEVHDVLGSSLSAIKFKAEEAVYHLPKDGTLNVSKPLETLTSLVQDTIEAARRIQADLRPPLLDDLGIVATLVWFCRRFETIYSGIKVEQTVIIREEGVPGYLKAPLFRITQEAMNNIGKHAKADSVHLGLRKVDNAIELSIEDNGEGFDPESLSSGELLKKGLGLSSMKERVELLGGSFSIDSVKGKGTVIRAVWPV